MTTRSSSAGCRLWPRIATDKPRDNRFSDAYKRYYCIKGNDRLFGGESRSSGSVIHGCEVMQSCWVLLTASLTSLAFAVEPQISSVAALSSQETLLPVSAQSRTPIVPVSEPITFVKATATAPPFFGTLSRKPSCSKEQGVFQLILP